MFPIADIVDIAYISTIVQSVTPARRFRIPGGIIIIIIIASSLEDAAAAFRLHGRRNTFPLSLIWGLIARVIPASMLAFTLRLPARRLPATAAFLWLVCSLSAWLRQNSSLEGLLPFPTQAPFWVHSFSFFLFACLLAAFVSP